MIDLIKSTKNVFDPKGILNPYKVLPNALLKDTKKVFDPKILLNPYKVLPSADNYA